MILSPCRGRGMDYSHRDLLASGPPMSTSQAAPPAIGKGFLANLRYDVPAGFLVFLIALPLCLGIAKASEWPPMSGIFAAILGGILVPLFSNSELTIKGPAAGLIVIALGCIGEFRELAPQFGYDGVVGSGEGNDPALGGYRLALGVCVASGVVQILLGLFRAGALVELFPLAAVHGMLAAIGIIIFSKQSHLLLGVTPAAKEPLDLLRELPHSFLHMNPVIMLIGFVSLLILFGLPLVKIPAIRKLPAPMLVLLITIPMGLAMGLSTAGTSIRYFDHVIQVGPQFLVSLPGTLLESITFPDFRGLVTTTGGQYVIMFALIGSLESLLAAKAIDLLDPWRRKTNFNRDLLAIGMANTAVACIGGLPMIAEIVRSSANINNGARTRVANMVHGLGLLTFVAFAAAVIKLIPTAALAAMLVYTGFRLASPKEFIGTYRIGREQLAIFVTTIIVTLATDLLIGIGAGIALKIVIHYFNGVSWREFVHLHAEVAELPNGTHAIRLRNAVVFSNWLKLRALIDQYGLKPGKDLEVDLYETSFVDHSVVERLHQAEHEFEDNRLHLRLIGLEGHRRLSSHPLSAIKRGLQPVNRLTIYAARQAESMIIGKLAETGVSGYTSIPVRGTGRTEILTDPFQGKSCTRIEVLTTSELSSRIIDFLHRQVMPLYPVTACEEKVMVLRADDFNKSEFERDVDSSTSGKSALTDPVSTIP